MEEKKSFLQRGVFQEPINRVVGGLPVYIFLIMEQKLSDLANVRLSVCLSVCLSIRPQNFSTLKLMNG